MRTLTAAFVCLLIATLVPTASAQDYGVGETIIVPKAPDSIAIDGVIDPDVWDTGASVDLLANAAFWSDDFPQQETFEASAQLLYANDTIYVHVFIDDDELYTNGDEPWQSDQLVIGFDPVHEAGETDQLVDQDDWAGWPENAPDAGPHAYRIYIGEDGGNFTLNWGFSGVDPVAEGWVNGVVYTDEENQDWGIEAAFYVPGVEDGAQIGFNAGGAQANAAACDELGECAYGYYSHWSTENPGGDVNSRTDSYGTLQMGAGGGEGYGSGNVVQVPQVDPGAITIDGQADEAAWADAQADVDATQYWNSYGPVGEATPSPDLVTETRLLWSQDTLYVYHLVQDIEIFWGGDTGSNWNSDMLLIGLDNSFEGDSLFDPDFGGGAFNAPQGPYTYFINEPAGFTFAWNGDIVPGDSGWVNGAFFLDEDNLEWGIEAAFYVPNAEMDAMVGFDIGGAQASAEQCEEGYCDYAYYAWQSGANGVDPGTINRDASQWAALHLVEEITSAIEETPGDGLAQGFALRQNYPNPFRSSTHLSYTLAAPGHVRLAVYDVLGRQVATLVDGARAANSYQVTWETEGLPGGLYFYRLEIDGTAIATRTMTVLK